MKLSVGLISPSAMWEQLLSQEGVPGELVASGDAATGCSILVLNRFLSEVERQDVEAFLKSGGAVLGYAHHMEGVCGTRSRKERIDYITSDPHGCFTNVHLIDLSINAMIPREANCLRTQQNVFAAYAGKLGGGYAVILPFDPAEMMSDSRPAVKNFYSTRERLPFERVSVVAKGEIRHLLHAAFRYLHHVRNLPYIHTWYFPNGMKNMAAFRVDTDKGTREEIDRLSHIALQNDVFMSWFVDVKSHEEWLQHFAFLAGQEIGVHCYEHQTYDTFDANLKNISKAKHKLQQTGVSTPGFSAPFGIWNPELAKAIDKTVFEYSSEFSFLYDSFPLYPSDGRTTFLTPQIPIHPICIGSLRKTGFPEQQMKEYFRRVIDEKLLREEPLFFYHHPTHHCWDVVTDMFEYLEEKGIENMTMVEFARWWGKRLKYRPSVFITDSTIRCEQNSTSDDSVWVRVIDSNNRESIMRPFEQIDLNGIEWTPPRKVMPPPGDIHRIREFDPRRVLGGLVTTFARKLTERKARE